MTRVVSLGEVVSATGTRNPTLQPEADFLYVDVAAVDNSAKNIIGAKHMVGSNAPSRARKVLAIHDVLVSTVRPNLNAVALVPPDLDGQIASTGFCVLRAKPKVVLPEYVFYFVRSKSFVEALSQLVSGALYPAVSDRQVLDQKLPLPSLGEQRRIVDVLSRAEGIVHLRREAEAKAQAIIPALFLDMFGDPATNPKGWPFAPLSEVADVISGIAKGRKLSRGDGVEMPYMRVANVKDGYLDLSEVKTMEIRRSEVNRLLIRPGDLLMTEGGDPDKLGRAALWSGEIASCVHQNHVFKVRTNRNRVLPTYLRALAGSVYGKDYFLRVAKKTTGIASINKTQLSAFPVLLPPLELQNRFETQVAAIDSIAAQQKSATTICEATFAAILARTFSGDLTTASNAEETAVA